MKLTREADYAILALIYLASETGEGVKGRPAMASQLGIPNTFLAKILRKLSRACIVESFAGARGGYRLAGPADQISLASVIEAIDGPIALVRCLDVEDPSCRPFCGCLALEGLARVQEEITSLLGRVSLADILPSQENLLRVAPARPALRSSLPLYGAATGSGHDRAHPAWDQPAKHSPSWGKPAVTAASWETPFSTPSSDAEPSSKTPLRPSWDKPS